MAEETQKAIEITEFVPASQVDPVYFDGAYYLGPDQGGDKAYKLLVRSHEADRALGPRQVGGARQAVPRHDPAREERPGDAAAPLRRRGAPFSEVPVGDAELKDSEMKLAIQLVEQIASDEFKPENYEDEVKKRYHEAIQRKVEGQEVTSAPEAPRAQIIDLMEALKASLASKGTKPGAARDDARREGRARRRGSHRHRRQGGQAFAARRLVAGAFPAQPGEIARVLLRRTLLSERPT